MATPVIFHGTQQEAYDLVAALQHNCTCDAEKKMVCDGHKAMKDSQSFVDHMLFARWMRNQFVQGEWLGESPPE